MALIPNLPSPEGQALGRELARPDRMEIAGWVRDAAEAYYPANPLLTGHCSIISTALVLALKHFRYRARAVFGYYRAPEEDWAHYWCVVGSRIIDLAATQFCGPRILVAGRDDPRYILPAEDDWRAEMEVQVYRVQLKKGECGMLADAFAVADIAGDCITGVARS